MKINALLIILIIILIIKKKRKRGYENNNKKNKKFKIDNFKFKFELKKFNLIKIYNYFINIDINIFDLYYLKFYVIKYIIYN